MNSIFKAYDIRGIYPEEINEDLAFRVGRAAARYLKAKKMVVGHDARAGSESMAKKLIDGIIEAGCEVISIGETTTPLFYFSVNTTGADGGIMITASHNPKQYNGFKIVGRQAEPVGLNSGLAEIQKMLDEPAQSETRGSVVEKQFVDDYVNFLLEETLADKEDLGKMKIVVDTSNGMTVLVLKNLFSKINVTVVPLFFDIDGTFPNHSPDTSREENLRQLQNKVLEIGADLGVAFDGDGDRLALVDNMGEVIWPDYILALLFEAMNRPLTVYDIRVSRAIKQIIGARGIPSRVGYSFIRKAMREHDAELGGELSGHFFFKEMHYAESAVLAMLIVIMSMNKARVPISKIVEPLHRYAHSGEIRIEIQTSNFKTQIADKLKAKYKGGKIDETDGITIEFNDWWFNVRPSNTEPILRLVIEADNHETLEKKKAEILDLIGVKAQPQEEHSEPVSLDREEKSEDFLHDESGSGWTG